MVVNMAKIIAIVNQKGGVAKTTTTNAMGIRLAAKGYRVLALDLDPQGNLSMSFGLPFPDTESETMASLILLHLQERNSEINITDYVRSTHGVDFIAGNDDLGKVERMLSGWRDGEYVLQSILEPLRECYDYILIDCMPSIGNLTENAIVAADEVLVPSEPQYFSTKGIQSLFDDIGEIKRRKNPQLTISGILPTKVDTRTNVARSFLDALTTIFGDSVYIFLNLIPASTKLAECNDGKNIYEYDKFGKGVTAYAAFVDEYLERRK